MSFFLSSFLPEGVFSSHPAKRRVRDKDWDDVGVTYQWSLKKMISYYSVIHLVLSFKNILRKGMWECQPNQQESNRFRIEFFSFEYYFFNVILY